MIPPRDTDTPAQSGSPLTPRSRTGGQLWQLDPEETTHIVGVPPPTGHQLGGRVILAHVPERLLSPDLASPTDGAPSAIATTPPGRVVLWFEATGRQQLAFLSTLGRLSGEGQVGQASACYFIPPPPEGLAAMSPGEWLACLNDRIPIPAEAPAQASGLLPLILAGDLTGFLRRLPAVRALPRPLYSALKWWGGQATQHEGTGEPILIHELAALMARLPGHTPAELLKLLNRVHPRADLQPDELTIALGRARRLITPRPGGPIPGLGPFPLGN